MLPIMDNPTQILLAEINAHLERTGTAPSVFGWEAVKDPNFVRNLRSGREPRFGTIQRVKEYMAAAQESAA